MIASVALAVLGATVFLQPAAARPMNRCELRYSYCAERCIMNNTGSGIDSCFARTCDHQRDNCTRDSAGGGGGGGGGRGGGRGGSSRIAAPTSQQGATRPPLDGGLLDSIGGFSTQGPAASGSPVPSAPAATPAPPPVIIR
jgi:hypothetical protein